MSTGRRKLYYAIGCGVAAILLCLAGGIGIFIGDPGVNSCSNDRQPLRSFVITIDIGQQKHLIEELQKFADKNGFRFQMSVSAQNGQVFLLNLTRKDVEVLVNNSGIDIGKYYVTFRNNDCARPAVDSDITGLVSDLKGFISELPTATISEEK